MPAHENETLSELQYPTQQQIFLLLRFLLLSLHAPASLHPHDVAQTGRYHLMIPSIKTLQTGLRLDRSTAKTVRRIMEFVSQGDRRPYHALQEIDTILCTSGVEGFKLSAMNGTGVSVCYCNTGETYRTTVCYVWSNHRYITTGFKVCSWGNLIETCEMHGMHSD
jgi:hypothetical protein